MSYTSTYEIHYSDKCAVYILRSIREAIAQFETEFPAEVWTYAKDLIHGNTLSRNDYDRMVQFEKDAEPKRQEMMAGLRWPSVIVSADVVPATVVNVKKHEPYQGKLF